MGKITTALIGVAVALGYWAARSARKSEKPVPLDPKAPDSARQSSSESPASGMVVLRNDPIDNGIAVRSPFARDPGIVRPQPSTTEQGPDTAL